MERGLINIRGAEPGDLGALLAINAACTPGVGKVTEVELARLIDMAALTLVAEAVDAPLGFIVCMLEGCDYASLNYQWVAENHAMFAYCDRIAVAPAARGQRIGEQLYDAAREQLRLRRQVLLCEVNLQPPNPGSLRFHERLGFRQVGERWSADRSYGVVYLRTRLINPNSALDLIRQCLYETWDPIGVNNMPGTLSEYDGYAPEVLRALRAGSDENRIAKHLEQIERENMGLSGLPDRCRLAARALIAIWNTQIGEQ